MNGHVTEQLSAFLDGELEEREHAAVARHLEACAECARHLEELLAVDRLAAGVAVVAPEGYFDGFAARVRDRIRKRPPRVLAPVWALAAAAGLLLAVTVPTLLRQRPLVPAEAPVVADVAPPTTDLAIPEPQAQARDAFRGLGYVGQDKRDDAPRSRAAANAAPAKKAPALKDEAISGEKPAPSLAAPAAPPPPAAPAVELPFAQDAEAPEREVAALAEAAPQQAERDAYVEERKQRQEGARAKEQTQAAGFAGAPAEAVASGVEDSKRALQKTTPSAAFRALLDRRAETIAEARGLREAWRAFAGGAVGTEADEARVRVIESGREAFRLSGERADLDLLRRDAAAYLKREDAHQADRVRALLRGLPR